MSIYRKKVKKKVRFAPQYDLLKWCPDKQYQQEKSWRERIDMGGRINIEEELINNHEQNFGNKRDICSKRLACRDMVIQGVINPYMFGNDYLEDLQNRDTYLRPQDSNTKSEISNKYLKED